MFSSLKERLFSQSPSVVLTMILGPCFMLYGFGLLLGYRSNLIKILGLPSYVYATMFILAGALKLCGIVFHWGRASHTIGVTVATFWALAIIVFLHSAAAFAGALPWFAIALIALVAAVWPAPFNSTYRVIKESSLPFNLDITDPSERASEVADPIIEREQNGYSDSHNSPGS